MGVRGPDARGWRARRLFLPGQGKQRQRRRRPVALFVAAAEKNGEFSAKTMMNCSAISHTWVAGRTRIPFVDPAGAMPVVSTGESLHMPNDAKLGMIVGVGLVIAIAVVFFRKEEAFGPSPAEQPSATAVGRPGVNPAVPPGASAYRGVSRTVQARTAIRTGPAQIDGQRHVVSAGETLFSLAQRYYQDEKKFVEIYRVNQEVIKNPDRLPPGTVLVIPKLP
jgi:nucleoid-associated protein YgaU